MGLFERYLAVWVGLSIVAGLGLGPGVPRLFHAVAAMEFAQVNPVVGVFIWVMIYPMMIQIDFASIKDIGQRPRGLMLTLVINWVVKPFTLVQVFAFAPIAAFLLGVSNVTVTWNTLLVSTVLYVVLPLLAGGVTRHLWLKAGGSQSFNAVNQMRVLGRWMRMLTNPNQSLVIKAFQNSTRPAG